MILYSCAVRVDGAGTIQLDFHQPTAFELQYVDANGDRQTPVLVHRAV